MSSSPKVKVVLGCGFLGAPQYPTVDAVRAYVDAFHAAGFTEVDSSRGYPANAPGLADRMLCDSGATSWAVVETKVLSFGPGAHEAANVARSIDESLEALRLDSVDLMYLHVPCRDTPFEVTVEAMDKAFREGKFKRWGLSNYKPSEVDEIVEICKRRGFEPPSVYQGHYNGVARLAEDELVPTLRKYGMQYYAYSPSGAGFFSGKVNANSPKRSDGRFSRSMPGSELYSGAYLKPDLLEASQRIVAVAKEHGTTGHGAALRWALHHSVLEGEYGDAIIIGGSTVAQLEENLKIVKQGPLPDELVRVFDEVWPVVRPSAPWAWIEWTAEEASKAAADVYEKAK